MGRENPTRGEERIADEISPKLGIRVSPRTVGKYLKRGNPRGISVLTRNSAAERKRSLNWAVGRTLLVHQRLVPLLAMTRCGSV